MAMVSEAIGLTIPNVSMIPGVYAERAQAARRAGRLVMQMLEGDGPLPRDVVTRRSLENGAAIVAATGGSTNAALHLPALANEAGIAFTIDDVGEVFARTPLIGNLRPGGKYTAKDVYDVGGTAVVVRALVESGHIDGDCLTITGRTIAEEYGDANAPDGEVIFGTNAPIMPDGGVAVLKGNFARMAPSSRSPVSRNYCSKAPCAYSKMRRPASMRSAIAPMLRARCSLFATKVRSAVRACARCLASPR